MNWYGILKVVHVLSAIVWMGGGAALIVVLLRLARSGDRAALRPLVPQIAKFMQSIGGPASGLLLISGIAMVLTGHMSFKSLWLGLGFGGLIVLGAFGGLVMSKRMAALERAVASDDDAALSHASAQVRQGSTILLTIMAAIVAVMVLKPTL
jgi:uncharacterized membrane protein